jgi:hypothetical protein
MMPDVFSDAQAIRSMGYKSAGEREEIMARRRQHLEWWEAKGYDLPCFGSFLLANCSPFTEMVWRERTRRLFAQRTATGGDDGTV